jgi:hypothetical protein
LAVVEVSEGLFLFFLPRFLLLFLGEAVACGDDACGVVIEAGEDAAIDGFCGV